MENTPKKIWNQAKTRKNIEKRITISAKNILEEKKREKLRMLPNNTYKSFEEIKINSWFMIKKKIITDNFTSKDYTYIKDEHLIIENNTKEKDIMDFLAMILSTEELSKIIESKDITTYMKKQNIISNYIYTENIWWRAVLRKSILGLYERMYSVGEIVTVSWALVHSQTPIFTHDMKKAIILSIANQEWIKYNKLYEDYEKLTIEYKKVSVSINDKIKKRTSIIEYESYYNQLLQIRNNPKFKVFFKDEYYNGREYIKNNSHLWYTGKYKELQHAIKTNNEKYT